MSRAREATRQCQPLQIQCLQRWSRNHGPPYMWQRRASTLFHTLCPSSLEPAESSPSVQTCMLQKKATARARRAVVMLFVMNLKLALEYITPRLSAGFYCRWQHQASKVEKKKNSDSSQKCNCSFDHAHHRDTGPAHSARSILKFFCTSFPRWSVAEPLIAGGGGGGGSSNFSPVEGGGGSSMVKKITTQVDP